MLPPRAGPHRVRPDSNCQRAPLLFMPTRFLSIIALLLGGLCLGGPALALTEQEALAMTVGESDARIEAINQAVAKADDKTVNFLQALADDAVKIAGQKVLIVRGDQISDPVTGAALALPEGAEDVVSNNRMRSEIDNALASLKLLSPDPKVRRRAIKALQGEVDASKLPLLDKAWSAEPDPELKNQLSLLRASVLLDSAQQAQRLQAAGQLQQLQSLGRVSLMRGPRQALELDFYRFNPARSAQDPFRTPEPTSAQRPTAEGRG